jgi:hypothetical protein
MHEAYDFLARLKESTPDLTVLSNKDLAPVRDVLLEGDAAPVLLA